VLHQQVARFLVLRPGSRGQFAGVPQVGLVVQKGVGQSLDREPFGVLPGLVAGVQVVLLVFLRAPSGSSRLPK
jgi:hypothetical protein